VMGAGDHFILGNRGGKCDRICRFEGGDCRIEKVLVYKFPIQIDYRRKD